MIYTDGIHMVADSLVELHSFAEQIALPRRYFEGVRKGHPHYDLKPAGTLKRATDAGASIVSPREILIRSKSLLKKISEMPISAHSLDISTRVLIEEYQPDVVVYVAASVGDTVTGWSTILRHRADGRVEKIVGAFDNQGSVYRTLGTLVALETALVQVWARKLRAVILMEGEMLRIALEQRGTLPLNAEQKVVFERVLALFNMLRRSVVLFPLQPRHNSLARANASLALASAPVTLPFAVYPDDFPLVDIVSEDDHGMEK